jgi:predicted MFS family arabinose efflux permease
MDQDRLSASREWGRHWPLVLAAATGFSFMSFLNPATGLFMEPLQAEFGWSRSLLSAGPVIGAVLVLFLSPAFGALVDRFGSRRLALPGLIATALAIAAFSQLSGSKVQWFAIWAVYSLCCLAIQSTTWTTAVASVFSAGRGLALGMTLAGSAFALAIVPPLTNWLIAAHGWRSAFVWLGLGWGGIALVLSWFFLFGAHDGRQRAEVQETKSTEELPGLAVSEAWRNSALWRVAIATLLILTITVGINVHQVPILVSAGVTRTNAAWLASLGGIAGIAGKLLTGVLIDRYHARWVGGLTLASTAIAYPLLLEPLRTPALITIAIMINGYAAGTKIQLCSYLTARYGGMRNYGTIFGFMSSMIGLAGGLGPVLAGLCYDKLGNYSVFLIAGAAISLLSGLLIFSLGRYPRWS